MVPCSLSAFGQCASSAHHTHRTCERKRKWTQTPICLATDPSVPSHPAVLSGMRTPSHFSTGHQAAQQSYVTQVSMLRLLGAGCRFPTLNQAASGLFTILLGNCLPIQCSILDHSSWSLSAALAKEAPTRADTADSVRASGGSGQPGPAMSSPHS